MADSCGMLGLDDLYLLSDKTYPKVKNQPAVNKRNNHYLSSVGREPVQVHRL